MDQDLFIPALLLTTLLSYLIYSLFFSSHGTLSRQSLKLCKSGRYFEAISTLERLIKMLPLLSHVWSFNQALLLSETGQYHQALKIYDLVIKHGRYYYNYNFLNKVWFNKGLALSNLDKYADAIVNYDLAFQTPCFGFLFIGRSFFYRIWYHRGLALHKLGKYTEAIDDYDQALSQNLYPLWSGIDRCTYQFRSYEKILAKYNPSLKHKPDMSSIWKSKSLALYELERYEEAIANLDLIPSAGANSHDCFYNKARCYAKLGKINLALENLQQSLGFSQDEHKARIESDLAFEHIRQNREFIDLLAEI